MHCHHFPLVNRVVTKQSIDFAFTVLLLSGSVILHMLFAVKIINCYVLDFVVHEVTTPLAIAKNPPLPLQLQAPNQNSRRSVICLVAVFSLRLKTGADTTVWNTDISYHGLTGSMPEQTFSLSCMSR